MADINRDQTGDEYELPTMSEWLLGVFALGCGIVGSWLILVALVWSANKAIRYLIGFFFS